MYLQVLVVYNFTCCFLSVYTTIGFLRGIYNSGNIYLKEPREELKSVFYLYWITKNIELMDTVFMILRHRSRQITFLHVYHHSSMVLLSDFGYHYTPWPAIAVILALNSFVHVLLYFYYGLTAWNPDNTPTWKKRLTEVQIIQFLIDFVFAAYGYVHHGFCIYGLIYGILMTYLFSNFYYAAYIKKRSKHAKKA